MSALHRLLPHAHPIEWGLLSIALISFLGGVWRVWQATSDRRALSTQGRNGYFSISAEGFVLDAWFFLTNQIIITLVAFAFLTTAPPPPDYSDIPQSLIGMLGYVMLTLVHILKSNFAYRTRHRLHSMAHRLTEFEATMRVGGNRGTDPKESDHGQDHRNVVSERH